MTKILRYLGLAKKSDPHEDRLYKFVKETKSRDQVKILKRAVLKANRDQRTIMEAR